MAKVSITTTTFAQYNNEPLEILREQGIEIIKNPYGRKLKNEEIFALCKDCAGIIAGTEIYDADILAKLKNLKVISRCGTGIDNIDLVAAKKQRIEVFNTPDALIQAVAELTVGLILALVRQIPLMDRQLHTGIWDKKMGVLLSGKKVGVVGFGRIGRRVAELLKAVGAEICYSDPQVDSSTVFSKVEFKELLRQSDIVSLHLSYSENNRNLIGKEEFALMKSGSYLINCSRGGIVDEESLYLALKNGKLTGAAIDVFEQEPYNGPLRRLDNVILTPHIASYAKEARINMEKESVNNLIKGFKEAGLL